jgi:probable HAF family extracellular repeat protein
MTRMKVILLVFMVLSAFLFLSGNCLSASYKFIDLGNLGGADTRASDINNKGQIVGTDATGNQANAFIYSHGVMTYLPILTGSNQNMAFSINNNGQVVGLSRPDYVRAFLYSGGVTIDLLKLTNSVAYCINDNNQVVGESNNHAFLYSAGVMTDLGTLQNWTFSTAYGINNSGQVVGDSYNGYSIFRAFLYSGGVMTDIGTLGGDWARAYHINDNGQVVGDSQTIPGSGESGIFHAFLYSGGMMIDLGTLGGAYSMATDLNNNGQVVGTAQTASGDFHAFLYSNGIMTDLTELVPGWSSLSIKASYANAINDSGQIVGYLLGQDLSVTSFLLTPVPLPPTVLLLGSGLLGLAGWRRFRKG